MQSNFNFFDSLSPITTTTNRKTFQDARRILFKFIAPGRMAASVENIKSIETMAKREWMDGWDSYMQKERKKNTQVNSITSCSKLQLQIILQIQRFPHPPSHSIYYTSTYFLLGDPHLLPSTTSL